MRAPSALWRRLSCVGSETIAAAHAVTIPTAAMVGPLAEWTKTWAQFERLVLKPHRDLGPEG